MLYAIFCYDNEAVVGGWSRAKDDEVMADLEAVQARVRDRGRLGPVARLAPTTAAVTVRKGLEAMVIDGPFAETKEQLLGFYVVEVEGLEEAIELARELAAASGSAGSFELRPVNYFRPNGVAE